MRRRLNPAGRAAESRVESEEPEVRIPERRLHRLTSEEVDELVGARLAGEEIDALAERFGIDRNTVMAYLKRRGVPGRRWPGRTLSPDQLEAAGRLYESGVRLELVGERFGVDRRYLRRVLPASGIAIRRAGQRMRG